MVPFNEYLIRYLKILKNISLFSNQIFHAFLSPNIQASALIVQSSVGDLIDFTALKYANLFEYR